MRLRKLYEHPIFIQLVVFTVLIGIVPLILISGFVFYKMADMAREEVMDSHEQVILQYTDGVEEKLRRRLAAGGADLIPLLHVADEFFGLAGHETEHLEHRRRHFHCGGFGCFLRCRRHSETEGEQGKDQAARHRIAPPVVKPRACLARPKATRSDAGCTSARWK